MKNVLRNVAKQDSQKDAECLVVILMSHGKEGVIYGSDDEVLNLKRHVYEPFNNEKCPALKGKPKLFFVQACCGARAVLLGAFFRYQSSLLSPR
ncbi:hypothetical protein HPB48_013513 [Haemaphysalis longicornis]|uniref:Caspase family p20 domain-containing protein n=1 Tax=Haemaphysalis longicornis TaxID=44386 RepID=A0A9J6GS48_HAELO|nr:hypothetical protein HPB48_013513 [Haemaphysalis longicornis]